MPASFALHFRQHITPQLLNLARAEAVCVAQGVETFDGAWSAVMAHARRYGALHLPGDVLLDLDEWICLSLAEALEAAERAGADVE